MKIFSSLAIFFILSYGMLYFSYKFYIPLLGGGNDIYAYYNMYLNPLDFTQADAPFIYRQFSALITNLIYEIGLFYDAEISFSDTQISKRLFFAAILSNYFAVVLTALVVSKTVDLYIKNSYIYPVIGGMLCLMSFGVSSFVLTGLTEGWTWFLIAIGFYALKSKSLKLFLVIALISIFQKEIISIAFGIFSLVYLGHYFKNNENSLWKKFYLKTFLISLGTFITYVGVRKVIIPVDGYSNQLSPNSWIDEISRTQFFEISYIIPTLLSSNLLYLLIFLFLMLIYRYKQNIEELNLLDFIAIVLTTIVFYWIGTAVGLEHNIGRILLTLSPIISVLITYYFYCIEEKVKYLKE